MEKKWQEMYKSKLMSAEEAAKFIKDGMLVASGAINAQAAALSSAIGHRMASGDLKNVRFLCSLSARPTSMHNPELLEKMIANGNMIDAMYAGPFERYFLEQGYYSYVPHRLFDGPMMTARVGLDAAVMVVSPMDRHGYVSTGVNPDYVYGFIRRNPGCVILAEINQHMPRAYGNNHFHISELAAVVENDQPLVELPSFPLTKRMKRLASLLPREFPMEHVCS